MNTKKRLIEAGIKLLDERGLEKFSIRNVNRICGFTSSATPYEYYQSKQELLGAILEYLISGWISCCQIGARNIIDFNTADNTSSSLNAINKFTAMTRNHPWIMSAFLLMGNMNISYLMDQQVAVAQTPIFPDSSDFPKETDTETLTLSQTAEMVTLLYIIGSHFVEVQKRGTAQSDDEALNYDNDFLNRSDLFLRSIVLEKGGGNHE